MPPRPAPTARSSSRSSKRSDSLVPVGEVVAAHALGGRVRVRAYQPASPSLEAGRHVLLDRAGSLHEAEVESAAPHARGLMLVGFAGVTDRDAAEALVGARICVPAADLAPLAPDEFYWHEIAGFAVETTAGEPVGTVRETFSTGVNDVWVVEKVSRSEEHTSELQSRFGI